MSEDRPSVSNSGFPWGDHIEVLVPGILLVAEIMYVSVKHGVQTPLNDPLVAGATFVAAAYALGLVGAYVGRVVLDAASESFMRGWVFQRFSHADRLRLVAYCLRAESDKEKFEADLQLEYKKHHCATGSTQRIKALRENHLNETNGGPTQVNAEWNAVYRSMLRQTTRQSEVSRRRAMGRSLRGVLLPTILVPLVLISSSARIHQIAQPFVLVAGALVGVSLLGFCLLFLHAYAEYVNFAEAYDIGMYVRVQEATKAAGASR